MCLLVPGRWGSTDPWLGIPVKWPQISAARIIIESGSEELQDRSKSGNSFLSEPYLIPGRLFHNKSIY